ncbi:MAG: VOC family protein [Rhodospirillales bacterium]|nr:VOC family protein [Rhodospirillales bacterium]
MRLHQITPFVPCTSLDRQIGFYRDMLGFALGFQAENYAFMRRDDVAIRLIEVDATVDLSLPERQGSFYIDVRDIDALYQSLEPRLRRLPEGRVRAPFNQDYGQREFHVIDEDCTLIFFGEAASSEQIGRS